MANTNIFGGKSEAACDYKINMLNLFLTFLALLQGTSQLLGAFWALNSNSQPTLLKAWISLGNEISQNWEAVSVSLVGLVLGYILYIRLSNKSCDLYANKKSGWLLFINLFLCLRVYSNDSIAEKFTYLASYLLEVIIVVVITIFVIAIILILQKEHKNEKDRDEQLQEDKAGLEIDATTGMSENNTDMRGEIRDTFQFEHPFSYICNSFIKDLKENRRIKIEYKKEVFKIKTDAEKKKSEIEIQSFEKRAKENGYIPESGREKAMGNISALIAFAACGGLIVSLFVQNADAVIVLRNVTSYIFGITGVLDAAKGPLTNFLLSSGVLFLFVILMLILFLTVYTSLRVVVYLLSHTEDDTNRIYKISQSIKKFFFGILDGALRPLMFLPDFLECLEMLLLDSDS